jgi:hypothetical protein
MSEPTAKGLTYADAGVDIDAGNDMVQQIKPLVRAAGSAGCSISRRPVSSTPSWSPPTTGSAPR